MSQLNLFLTTELLYQTPLNNWVYAYISSHPSRDQRVLKHQQCLHIMTLPPQPPCIDPLLQSLGSSYQGLVLDKLDGYDLGVNAWSEDGVFEGTEGQNVCLELQDDFYGCAWFSVPNYDLAEGVAWDDVLRVGYLRQTPNTDSLFVQHFLTYAVSSLSSVPSSDGPIIVAYK